MVTERVKDAIRQAIQMEKDGNAFYLRAAAQCSDEMGSKIFESIARDELVHLKTFQAMFEERLGEEDWDAVVYCNKKYANLPVFPTDLSGADGASPSMSELDALGLAMDSEKKAIEYYGKIRDDVGDPDTEKIIDEIIAQEQNHYLILNEEFTHLSKMGYWFEMDYLGG